MSFELHVDAPRWRRHLASVAGSTPGLVPVVKGNGYGLGRDLLAAEATSLGCDVLAVGTYDEVPQATLHPVAGDGVAHGLGHNKAHPGRGALDVSCVHDERGSGRPHTAHRGAELG